MGGHWVAQLPDLLPALESTAGRVDHKQTAPVDVHVATFISARLERRMENDLAALSGSGLPDAVAVAQLRALAHLQSRFQIRPLPALAAWLAAQAAPVLVTWRNRERRAAIAERLQALVDAGYLAPMLAALDDPAARTADVYESRLAADELGRIDAELAQIASGARIRAAAADRLGQEIAAGFGLAALAAVLVATALG
jgi:eukaryotic-like serine/threonine-protein kinase